ncbi:TetR family transcriptional regulator, partial [Arthrobacter sp. H41]|uniref:TetR family transcriptional regulator n=1 Tax=Arthrobacter sp. H41 TaxID=1312978 RepID=UPI0012DD3BAA
MPLPEENDHTAQKISQGGPVVGGRDGKSARGGRLSRDIVLAAALELVDDEGLESLSMRRLGHKLGKDPMALYRYAANRDALHDGLT